MRARVRRLSIVWLASLGVVLAPPATADEESDLRRTLETQAELIDQLGNELEQVRSEQEQSQERIQALEGQQALPEVSAVGEGETEVTPEYVDRRIEDFELSDNSRLFISGYATSQFMALITGTFMRALSCFSP